VIRDEVFCASASSMKCFFAWAALRRSREEERCTVYTLSLSPVHFDFGNLCIYGCHGYTARAAQHQQKAIYLVGAAAAKKLPSPSLAAVFFLFAPSLLLQSLSILRACVCASQPAREFLRKQSKGGAAENEFRRAAG
jgi:hypothetical protein